ncbi:hypothetical protein [Pedobacter cryophilus]|uniref:Transcriptional regulator n=1 Tax=Pedobacter cryophilus TaxID=2571271 RepID=A0A4U1BW99_9SPHI|nr:hypothetical protein [Pedobacter cryophilus]TKB96868.1 hypothetical protein FA046_12380 [Pedobacter cryophilus]
MCKTTNHKKKYTIGEHLKKAPGSYSENQYKMCLATGVTLRTLEKYINLPYGSGKSMSSDLFFNVVEYLKINQNELLTP